VELEGEQLRLYEAELKRARLILSGLKDEEDFRHQRFNILASLLRLRQICCHPALLDPAYREFSSAKLDALMDTIEPLIEEGHKVLVFSQFVELLKLVAVQLVASGISHLMLTARPRIAARWSTAFNRPKARRCFSCRCAPPEPA